MVIGAAPDEGGERLLRRRRRLLTSRRRMMRRRRGKRRRRRGRSRRIMRSRRTGEEQEGWGGEKEVTPPDTHVRKLLYFIKVASSSRAAAMFLTSLAVAFLACGPLVSVALGSKGKGGKSGKGRGRGKAKAVAKAAGAPPAQVKAAGPPAAQVKPAGAPPALAKAAGKAQAGGGKAPAAKKSAPSPPDPAPEDKQTDKLNQGQLTHFRNHLAYHARSKPDSDYGKACTTALATWREMSGGKRKEFYEKWGKDDGKRDAKALKNLTQGFTATTESTNSNQFKHRQKWVTVTQMMQEWGLSMRDFSTPEQGYAWAERKWLKNADAHKTKESHPPRRDEEMPMDTEYFMIIDDGMADVHEDKNGEQWNAWTNIAKNKGKQILLDLNQAASSDGQSGVKVENADYADMVVAKEDLRPGGTRPPPFTARGGEGGGLGGGWGEEEHEEEEGGMIAKGATCFVAAARRHKVLALQKQQKEMRELYNNYNAMAMTHPHDDKWKNAAEQISPALAGLTTFLDCAEADLAHACIIDKDEADDDKIKRMTATLRAQTDDADKHLDGGKMSIKRWKKVKE